MFSSEIGAFNVLGIGALLESNYVPDFSACPTDGPVETLRIVRTQYLAAKKASEAPEVCNSMCMCHVTSVQRML